MQKHINSFQTTGLFLYPLRTLEMLFSDVLVDIERDQWHKMGYKRKKFYWKTVIFLFSTRFSAALVL